MISILWKTVIEIGISYENILLQFTSTTKNIQIILVKLVKCYQK